MRITLETDYAIRMTAYLCQKQENLTGAAEISESAGVPLRFAKNILQKLAGAGIIKSRSGIYGGYTLNREPRNISLYDVIESIQGPIDLSRYTPEENTAARKRDTSCTYHEFFKQLSSEMESKLREANFDSLNGFL